ncbi:MAG: single-stranded DNA-binding protein [Candidatus Hydrogenedentota bacterium]
MGYWVILLLASCWDYYTYNVFQGRKVMARLELNRVILAGNLTYPPELKFTKSGLPVTTFSIALNKTFKNQAGETKKSTDFVRVVVWGKTAENCKSYLVKGQQVLVEGSIRSRQWETKDGKKASTIEIVASRVHFLDKPRSDKQVEIAKDETKVEEEVFADEEEADILISESEEEVPF